MLLLQSCSGNTGKGSDESDSSAVAEYHADHDIAMTLRSITDALQMVEPLDTTEYNFEGVLTDGEGRPLYTDIQGAPGAWNVKVETPNKVVIRNLFLGDLLPDHLVNYITASLNLNDQHIVHSDKIPSDKIETVIYNVGGIYLKMETRPAVAPNGLEGTLMYITASGNESDVI